MRQKSHSDISTSTPPLNGYLDPIIDQIAAETGAKKGAIAQPIRVACTGGAFSIGDTLELLGREETFFRID